MGEHLEISELLKQAETDSEAFRAEATAAMQAFTPDDREYVVQMLSDTVTIEKALQAWSLKLRPERERLLKKRTDRAFCATLQRNIGFTEDQAREEIEYMIDERLELLLDETVDSLYPLEEGDPPHSLSTQRAYALHFFSQTDEDIADFQRRYEYYQNYTHVAHAHRITVCDPYAPWLERQRCALQIRREREQTREEEESRLLTIDTELQELGNEHQGLVAQIMRKEWDFEKLTALREKYDKRVAALSARHATPVKKLKIFDDIVRNFRDKEVERLAAEVAKPSLQKLRELADEVDRLMLQFFDLSAKDEKSLLADLKRSRSLVQEKEMIMLIRKNRTAFEKRQAQLA